MGSISDMGLYHAHLHTKSRPAYQYHRFLGYLKRIRNAFVFCLHASWIWLRILCFAFDNFTQLLLIELGPGSCPADMYISFTLVALFFPQLCSKNFFERPEKGKVQSGKSLGCIRQSPCSVCLMRGEVRKKCILFYLCYWDMGNWLINIGSK